MKGLLINLNYAHLEICASDLPEILRKLNRDGIVLLKVQHVDELTVRTVVKNSSVESVMRITERCGGNCRILKASALHQCIEAVPKRMYLIICIFFLLVLTIYIPQHILFVKVIGNNVIPTKLIIDNAQGFGLVFGARRREISSEEIKNCLIGKISELEWVGVNTKGCVAEISVRERRSGEESKDNDTMVSNIVAERDGVIVSQTILEGTPLCSVGDAVVAEQMLVSGYTNCGLVIQASAAEAEVLARTKRNIRVVTPVCADERTEICSHEKRYSILCGKKLINLHKDSGISHGGCVKICKQNYLTLPGGFVLPVALITEDVYTFRTCVCTADNFSWLSDFSAAYLQSQMIAGQIIGESTGASVETDLACFFGEYDCIEMIGKRKTEENIYRYGATN